MSEVKKQKEEARNSMEWVEHLIKLIEANDERFSFEFGTNNNLGLYDKQKDIGYVCHIERIQYDDEGNPINL